MSDLPPDSGVVPTAPSDLPPPLPPAPEDPTVPTHGATLEHALVEADAQRGR